MAIPDFVLTAIREEQARQNGRFVPDDPAYLEKLGCHAELLTHQVAGTLLGYIFFYCNASDKRLSYVTLLGTSPESRGSGVGYGLLTHVLCLSRRRGFKFCQLEVHKENHHAIAFYERVGFRIEEERSEKYLMSIATA